MDLHTSPGWFAGRGVPILAVVKQNVLSVEKRLFFFVCGRFSKGELASLVIPYREKKKNPLKYCSWQRGSVYVSSIQFWYKYENWKSLIALREPFIVTGVSFLIEINRLVS